MYTASTSEAHEVYNTVGEGTEGDWCCILCTARSGAARDVWWKDGTSMSVSGVNVSCLRSNGVAQTHGYNVAPYLEINRCLIVIGRTFQSVGREVEDTQGRPRPHQDSPYGRTKKNKSGTRPGGAKSGDTVLGKRKVTAARQLRLPKSCHLYLVIRQVWAKAKGGRVQKTDSDGIL